MKKPQFKPLLGSALLVMGLSQTALANVFINEFHYDNTGTDTGEFIEIAGSAGTNLDGWTIVLYNGSNGAFYNSIELAAVNLADQCSGTGTASFPLPTNGIQNGAPDGIALVDDQGVAIEFISYEGSFTAVGGPADGMTSTDIGESEPGTTPVGQSLQLTTAGWTGPLAATSGQCNASQVLANRPPVANDDEFTTACRTPISFNVLDGSGLDTDEDGDILSVDDFTQPSSGMLLQLPSENGGQFQFTPTSCDTDVTFEYTVTDGEASDSATVTISVEPEPVVTQCKANDLDCIGEVINFNKTPFCDSVTPSSTKGHYIISTLFGTQDTADGPQPNDLDQLIRNKCLTHSEWPPS